MQLILFHASLKDMMFNHCRSFSCKKKRRTALAAQICTFLTYSTRFSKTVGLNDCRESKPASLRPTLMAIVDYVRFIAIFLLTRR